MASRCRVWLVEPPVAPTEALAGSAGALALAIAALLIAAVVTIYIVLGVLYESLIHPITILSTLPSAGIGALLLLLAVHMDLSVIAIIGIILLIGIVKKNGIMMVDFALEAERHQGLASCDAIFEACRARFRPILMTTLAAMIDHINKNEYAHILSVEDPIEFVHTSQKCLINQREVHRDTHGFNEALRSALREDPDYILVGELRDLETIRLALTAAETGHLVFATLHTSSAAKTIDRIIDVFPAGEKPMVRSMLSESLRAVISQALLKKVGGGRTAAWEIMVGIPAIRNLIREDKVAQMYSAIQTGQSAGMMTLDQHLQDLVKRGLILRPQAREYAKDKKLFD